MTAVNGLSELNIVATLLNAMLWDQLNGEAVVALAEPGEGIVKVIVIGATGIVQGKIQAMDNLATAALVAAAGQYNAMALVLEIIQHLPIMDNLATVEFAAVEAHGNATELAPAETQLLEIMENDAIVTIAINAAEQYNATVIVQDQHRQIHQDTMSLVAVAPAGNVEEE